jgi:hypothetical protein
VEYAEHPSLKRNIFVARRTRFVDPPAAQFPMNIKPISPSRTLQYMAIVMNGKDPREVEELLSRSKTPD